MLCLISQNNVNLKWKLVIAKIGHMTSRLVFPYIFQLKYGTSTFMRTVVGF